VSRRCDELGLSHKELVRRAGYKNIAKGLRRLEQLCGADFKGSAGLIAMLPSALDVPVDVVKQSVEETRRFLHESREAAWRAAFRPHAVILTERERPQPLFVAAVIGVEVLLRIDFDVTAAPDTFHDASVLRSHCVGSWTYRASVPQLHDRTADAPHSQKVQLATLDRE
jgi:hypothetical protein